MPSDSCIFCQASALTAKITKEDVLSKWIDDVLTVAVTGVQRSFERTVVGPDGAMSRSSWQGHSLAAIKVTVVCATCNNGWMSGYDGQVKHLLKDAILGQDISLTVDQQFVVATWATMKAMVLEYGWGAADSVFTQDDRSLLYRDQRPPAHVQVRLAAVESKGQPIQVFHRVAIRGPYTPTPRPEDLHVLLTMAWGCLVVQVLGGPTVGDEALRRAPVVADTYVQIYPPAERTVHWPPAAALDDDTIQRFSDPNWWRGSTFEIR